MKAFDRFRLYYTEERLETLKPVAVPHFLAWVRKNEDELASLKARVLKRIEERP
jgi:hypothetical protein